MSPDHPGTSAHPGASAQLRAVAVLAAGALVFLLGTPGIDFAGNKALQSEASRVAARKDFGPIAEVGIVLMDLNRAVRVPLTEVFGGIQPIFRIRQSWHLYRNGPPVVRRVEILVDGEQVYLTGSSEAAWREAELRYRRIRPPMETTAQEDDAKNTWGMVRWIVTAAREDFPGAEDVVVRALEAPWPGKDFSEHHAWESAAPGWKVKRR